MEPVKKYCASPIDRVVTDVTTSEWPELFFVSKPWQAFGSLSTLHTLTLRSILPLNKNVPPDVNNDKEVTPST